MKKFIASLFICCTSFIITAQNTNEAIEYMNSITEKVFELEDETWQYLKAVTKGKKASKVEDKRSELVQGIKTAKLYVGRRKDFEGNDEFRQAMLNYLDMQYTVLKEDYDKILDMEKIAEDSYDAMEAYLTAQEKASEKLDSSFQYMSNAQKNFAKTYGIELTDNLTKKGERIQKASAAISYYNDVYLIFFKSYKQEAYVLNAMNQEDLSAIVQHNNTLKQFTKEGLEELRKLPSYKGDASLKAEAMNVLKFYQKEADEAFTSVVNLFMIKDEFEEIQRILESKSKKQRTQKDIDQYNTKLNEYNQASEAYNKELQEANKERIKVLTDWQNKVAHFMNNHGS